MSTVRVHAEVSSSRCVNNLVVSKSTFPAFGIRHLLVPVAEGCQNPASVVTLCYICL